jgi:hypothetical protein
MVINSLGEELKYRVLVEFMRDWIKALGINNGG